MTTRNLTGRVERLEAGGGGNGWRAWASRPLEDWPDEALHDFICATVPGLAGRREPLTDEELAEIAGRDTVPRAERA